MSAPVMLRSNFSDFFGPNMLPVLEEVFYSELDRHPSRREQIFKIVQHDRDIYQSSEIHDLDMFNQMEEGESYSLKRPRQGAAKTLTIKKFGLGFSISEEMVADGKIQLITDLTKKLAKSGRESQEISAMNIMNNGTSSVTTSDGVALFSTAHTLPSGLTFANKLSTEGELSQSTLQTAVGNFEKTFVGDSGIIYMLRPKKLLVHTDNKRYARELVGSDLKPDTADNNLNAIKDDSLQVISSPHLASSSFWALIADAEDTGLRIVEREAMQTKAADPAVGFMNDSIIYKAKYREEVGALRPEGIYLGSS